MDETIALLRDAITIIEMIQSQINRSYIVVGTPLCDEPWTGPDVAEFLEKAKAFTEK